MQSIYSKYLLSDDVSHEGPLFRQESHFLKGKVSDSGQRSFNSTESTLFLSGTGVATAWLGLAWLSMA